MHASPTIVHLPANSVFVLYHSTVLESEYVCLRFFCLLLLVPFEPPDMNAYRVEHLCHAMPSVLNRRPYLLQQLTRAKYECHPIRPIQFLWAGFSLLGMRFTITNPNHPRTSASGIPTPRPPHLFIHLVARCPLCCYSSSVCSHLATPPSFPLSSLPVLPATSTSPSLWWPQSGS